MIDKAASALSFWIIHTWTVCFILFRSKHSAFGMNFISDGSDNSSKSAQLKAPELSSRYDEKAFCYFVEGQFHDYNSQQLIDLARTTTFILRFTVLFETSLNLEKIQYYLKLHYLEIIFVQYYYWAQRANFILRTLWVTVLSLLIATKDVSKSLVVLELQARRLDRERTYQGPMWAKRMSAYIGM